MYINKNIIEFNGLTYGEATLVCEKIAAPLKNEKKKSKPGWEIRLKTQKRNLQKQEKTRKRNTQKHAGTKQKRNTKK